MPNLLIDELLSEHDHMHQVLVAVHEQLDRLDQSEAPDLVLLATALHYMRKVPSVVHHPTEDLLFEHLLRAEPSLAPDIMLLREQHHELYELEAWLLDAVVGAAKTGAGGYPQLYEFGRRYLLVQEQHSAVEEGLIFPRASHVLRPEDWREIAAQRPQVEDPLFGRRVKERYLSLRRHLAEATVAHRL